MLTLEDFIEDSNWDSEGVCLVEKDNYMQLVLKSYHEGMNRRIVFTVALRDKQESRKVARRLLQWAGTD